MPATVRVPIALLLVFLVLGLQPPAAHALGVELYVQAPYDFANQSFELDELESQNLEPLFAHSFAAPYDAIESRGNALLQPLAAAGRSGHIDCSGLGVDFVCPDADWNVSADVAFHFTQRGQPTLSSYGDPTNNGVHVALDSQVQIGLVGRIHVTLPDSPIPDPETVTVPANALIGIHARADVTLYPVLSVQGFTVWFTNDSFDLDIQGLDGQAIGVGAIVGTGLSFVPVGGVTLGPIASGLLGGLVGEVALEAAKDKAKEAVEKLVADQIASAGPMLTKEIDKALQPKLTQANNLIAMVKNAPIPGIGQTLGQLENALGLSLDVRSITRQDSLRSAVTARFANVAATTSISGRIRFPQLRCDSFDGYSTLTGRIWGTLGLLETNTDLRQASCAELLASEFSHTVYYGADPEGVLESGDAQNHLLSWGALGQLSSEGDVLDEGDAYSCPFTLSGLPEAAIVEIGAARGSSLEARLAIVPDSLLDVSPSARPKLGRFLVSKQAGFVLAVDHAGNPVSSAGVTLGRGDPDLAQNCPGGSSGGGLQEPPTGVPDLNPDHCIQCTFQPGRPLEQIERVREAPRFNVQQTRMLMMH